MCVGGGGGGVYTCSCMVHVNKKNLSVILGVDYVLTPALSIETLMVSKTKQCVQIQTFSLYVELVLPYIILYSGILLKFLSIEVHVSCTYYDLPKGSLCIHIIAIIYSHYL